MVNSSSTTSNTPTNSSPPIEQAQTMLDTLAPDGKGLTFQTFDDNADRHSSAMIKQYHGSLSAHAQTLEMLNGQGAGVFITVNATDGMARKKDNVTAVRALYVDFDTASPNRLDMLLSLPLVPSMVIESSKDKHHAYWIGDGIPLDSFTQWQKTLISYFNGLGDAPDKAVHDLPRVMRLAGFNHCKVSSKKGLTGEPFLTRIVHHGQRYRFEDIERFISHCGGNLPAQLMTEPTSKNTKNKQQVNTPILPQVLDDSHLPNLSAEQVRTLARGRWQAILGHLNYHVSSDVKEHSQCPVCGGTDRFRFDNANGTGSFICSQGTGDTIAGDGLSLLADHAGLGIHDAIQAVTAVLNDMGLISSYDDKTQQARTDCGDPEQQANYPEWRSDPQLNEPMEYENGRFELYHDGLFFVKYNDDDPVNITFKFKSFICSSFNFIAMVRDINSSNWGKLISFYDADNKLHTWSMPLALLQGDAKEYRKELASQGLNITTNPKQRSLLDAYIQNYPVQQRARCVDKLGWDGEQYILPDKAIGGDDNKELIVYQSANSLNSTLAQQGTLTQWRDELCQPLAGQSRLVFSICTAFAGHLLEPLGSDGGGFHITGSSSMGKSSSLRVAASVWGNPDKYVKTWRQTDNALESTASEHNDGFLGLDEISECEPKIISKTIYMLANGTGKNRSTVSGHNRIAKTWRVMFLSNGEQTIQQHMAEVAQKTNAGVEVRVAHIDADAGTGYKMFDSLVLAGTGAAQADKIKELSQAYYGVAGMAWLEHITTDKAATTATAKQLVNDFMSNYSDLAAQAHRVAYRFAIVAAAGEMATSANITGWQVGQATTAVRVCLDNWLDNYGRDGEHEQRQIISHIQAFIEQHGSSRFQPLRDSTFTEDERRVSNRVGYRNYDTDEFYFLSSAFSSEVCPPYDMKKVVQVLDDAGLLSKNEPSKKTLRITLPRSKARSRVYAVKGSILSYETDKTAGTARTQGTAHTAQGLEGVPSPNNPSGQRGHSEPQGGEVSAVSANPKTRRTNANPIDTGGVPLSALSTTKNTVAAINAIPEPSDEIPPFGSEVDYF